MCVAHSWRVLESKDSEMRLMVFYAIYMVNLPIKAAPINIFIQTIAQVTMCSGNVLLIVMNPQRIITRLLLPLSSPESFRIFQLIVGVMWLKYANGEVSG